MSGESANSLSHSDMGFIAGKETGESGLSRLPGFNSGTTGFSVGIGATSDGAVWLYRTYLVSHPNNWVISVCRRGQSAPRKSACPDSVTTMSTWCAGVDAGRLNRSTNVGRPWA